MRWFQFCRSESQHCSEVHTAEHTEDQQHLLWETAALEPPQQKTEDKQNRETGIIIDS